MTTQSEAGMKRSFVRTALPWMIAAAVAVIYLLTLNQWLSFKDLGTYSRVVGQTWMPEVFFPFFSLVTTPLHWLPIRLLPIGLNLFSLVCGFLTLALLARSVALFPYDRTHEQREREQSPFALLSIPLAWIPPVLGVLVFGLQLTFWENATNLTGAMVDLLLFAYSIRCLLEYRISEKDSWIWRAAAVYAVGITDSWVMMGLLPAFLVAVIWIKGLSFFQLRFVTRLFLCIVAGLLMYLYLPLLHLRGDGSFWIVLKTNIAGEFAQVVYICRYTPHHAQFLLLFTSLLPIFVIGIRWKSYFGDTSQIGVLLTTWILHLTHVVLLGVCIWAAFDTGFSLRDAEGKFPMLTQNRDLLLPLYYLSGLSVGYMSGYLLLVFRPLVQRMRRVSSLEKLLGGASATIVCLLLLVVPAGLLYKNIPLIKVTNGPVLKNYAAHLAENLPSEAIVLSDNWGPLLLTEAWLAQNNKATKYAFLETLSLKFPAYHQFEQKKYPDIWPALSTNAYRNDITFNDSAVTELLARLYEKRPLYYLHPSFGAYFETFYSVPHGMVYELKRYATNTDISAFYSVPHGMVYELKRYATNTDISGPAPTETLFAENENFWKQHESEIRALLLSITAPLPDRNFNLRQRLMLKLHIPYGQELTAVEMGHVYSRALNTWAVQAQRMGRLDVAGKHFEEATLLFPDNVVAGANLDFNKKLRAGEHVAMDDPSMFQERFGKFRGWEQTLNLDGMFDEPTGCLAQGIVFARGNMNRQAAQDFERALSLAPDSVLARLWLARVYVVSHTPERALPLIEDIKARGDALIDAAISSADIFQIELAANYASKKPEKIRVLLNNALSHNPPNTVQLDTATRVAMTFNDFTNALMIQEKELEFSPNDSTRLVNKGFIEGRLNRFDDAIGSLSQAISLQPTNSVALLYRANAYIQSDKLDEAQHDYEALQKLNPKAYPLYYSLAEVALRKKDTNTAIRYFEIYLTNAPPNAPDTLRLAERVKSLKSGAP